MNEIMVGDVYAVADYLALIASMRADPATPADHLAIVEGNAKLPGITDLFKRLEATGCPMGSLWSIMDHLAEHENMMAAVVELIEALPTTSEAET